MSCEIIWYSVTHVYTFCDILYWYHWIRVATGTRCHKTCNSTSLLAKTYIIERNDIVFHRCDMKRSFNLPHRMLTPGSEYYISILIPEVICPPLFWYICYTFLIHKVFISFMVFILIVILVENCNPLIIYMKQNAIAQLFWFIIYLHVPIYNDMYTYKSISIYWKKYLNTE